MLLEAGSQHPGDMSSDGRPLSSQGAHRRLQLTLLAGTVLLLACLVTVALVALVGSR
jgi:hypothetical protein